MDKLHKLVNQANAKGIKVEFVPSSKLHDFAGMNWETAKKFGIKDFPKNTIWIDQKFHPQGKKLSETQLHNLRHELDEASSEERGESYWQAHTEALRAESTPNVSIPRLETHYDKATVTHKKMHLQERPHKMHTPKHHIERNGQDMGMGIVRNGKRQHVV